MKNILCPTDFSDVSLNAIDYAAEMASKSGAELILYHLYHITPVDPGSGAYLSSDLVNAAEEKAKMELDKICNDIKASHGNARLSYEIKYGLATDEIVKFIKKKEVDMVVMGTKGAEGLRKLFFGSISGTVIEKAPCPVLVIPEHVRYMPIKEIVYATDLSGEETPVIKFIVELAEMYGAHISCFSIQKEEVKDPEAFVNHVLTHLLNKTEYKNMTFTLHEGKDIQEGIVNFCKTKNADVLAMATYERNFIEKVFSKSLTKEMAYHPELPVLSMHKKS